MAQPERARSLGQWACILFLLGLLAPSPAPAQEPADCIQVGHERGLRVVKSVCPNRDVMANMCSEDPEAYFNCSKRTFGMVTFGPTFHESSEWATGFGITGTIRWSACFVDDWTAGRCKPDLDGELNRLGVGAPRPAAGGGAPVPPAPPTGSPDPFAQATQDYARAGGSPSGSSSPSPEAPPPQTPGGSVALMTPDEARSGGSGTGSAPPSPGGTPSQAPGDPFVQGAPTTPGGPSDPFTQATQAYERQTRPPAPPPRAPQTVTRPGDSGRTALSAQPTPGPSPPHRFHCGQVGAYQNDIVADCGSVDGSIAALENGARQLAQSGFVMPSNCASLTSEARAPCEFLLAQRRCETEMRQWKSANCGASRPPAPPQSSGQPQAAGRPAPSAGAPRTSAPPPRPEPNNCLSLEHRQGSTYVRNNCNEKLEFKICVDHPDAAFPCVSKTGNCGAGEDTVAARGTTLTLIDCPQGARCPVYFKHCIYDEFVANRCRLPSCPK